MVGGTTARGRTKSRSGVQTRWRQLHSKKHSRQQSG